MSQKVFGNFDDKSTIILTLMKINNCLQFYFENSKFPELDGSITFDSFLNQILPDLTKSLSTHFQDKKVVNQSFFEQIKSLFNYYISLIQLGNIKISSLLLQIFISICSNFPSYFGTDVYNLTDQIDLSTIQDIFKLASENTEYLDIFILVLFMIIIKKRNFDTSSIIPQFITEFGKSINTFAYDKTDMTVFLHTFYVFDEILAAFPKESDNNSDQPNLFNLFLNFSIKALQLGQSIGKQKAALRFINAKIKNTEYSIEIETTQVTITNTNEDYYYGIANKQFSDSIETSSKSHSMDIVNSFNIEKETVDKNQKFVTWVHKFNPLIVLIQVDGHNDILQEINILIQKVCKIYENFHSVESQITNEVLSYYAIGIEKAYRSQKNIYVRDFVSVFTCLCSSSEDLAIEFLKSVTKKGLKQEKDDKTDNDRKIDNKDDDDGEGQNKSTLTVEISNLTLFEIGKNIGEGNRGVLEYILSIFEKQVYEYNDDSTIQYVIQLSKQSKIYTQKQLDYCLEILLTDKNPKSCIPKMIKAAVSNLNSNEVKGLFKKMASLLGTIDNEIFRSIAQCLISGSDISLQTRDSELLIQTFCTDDEGWGYLIKIFDSRKLSFFSNSKSWSSLIDSFCNSKKTKNSLDFLKIIFARLMDMFIYSSNPVMYNKIFSALINDYVEFENEESLNTFVIIEKFFDDLTKKTMYMFLINSTLKETIIDTTNENRYRALDFFRKLIEKIEWNMDFKDFKSKVQQVKEFKRFKEIKKPSNSFPIYVKAALAGTETIQSFKIEVTPDTMVNDILIFFAVGMSIYSRDIELFEAEENYYASCEIIQQTPKNKKLPRLKTIEQMELTSDSDLYLCYSSTLLHQCDFGNYFPSELLTQCGISYLLFELISKNDKNSLSKSAWKLLKLLHPIDMKTVISNPRVTFYSKLLFFKEFNYMIKQNPNYIKSPNIKNSLPSVIQIIIDNKSQSKLVKAALAIVMNDDATDAIVEGGIELIEILIDTFINQNNETLLKEILTVMSISQKSNQVSNLEYLVRKNSEFMKKCISLNSSSSFKDKELISKFFSNFNSISKAEIFNFCSNIFIENSIDCFALLKTTFSDNSDVSKLFPQCLDIYLDDDDNDLSDQYVKNLANFINFVLEQRESLVHETSNISTKLVSKAFREIDTKKQALIYKILLHYINIEEDEEEKNDVDDDDDDDDDYIDKTTKSACNMLIKLFDSFRSNDWSYNPNIQAKKTRFCGLRNLKMTCYMNSILQQISRNPMFRNSLFNLKDTENSIAIELQKIVARLELSNKSFVDTESFASAYKNKADKSFSTSLQEDAIEFFQNLIAHLPNELQTPFMGQYMHIFEGINVPYMKTDTQPFYSYDIPVSMPFDDAMKSNLDETFLVGSSQYQTDKYGKIDATFRKKISKFPNTFVIQLKRFEYSIHSQTRTKIFKSFPFPLRFNSMDYFADENNKNCPDIEYELKGVVVHFGNATEGHYNSIIKIDGKWTIFNDSEVEIIDDSRFDSLTKGGSSRKSCAYILFYVACNRETRQLIAKPPMQDNNNNNDVDVQIPNTLVDEIKKENDTFIKNQCIFSAETAEFAFRTSDVDIILPYFLNVFSHSAIIKSTVKSTQTLQYLLNKDPEYGFDFFFDNSEDKTESLPKVVEIMARGQDDFVNPFNSLLIFCAKGKFNQLKSVEDESDKSSEMKKIENIIFFLLKSTKESIDSWKSLKNFGFLIGRLIEIFYDLFTNKQLMKDVVLNIIDIITTFYTVTTSTAVINQVNFSEFFSILTKLNESIEKVEVFDEFMNQIKTKARTSTNMNGFNKLENAINVRKGIQPASTSTSASTTSNKNDYVDFYNYNYERESILNVMQMSMTLQNQYYSSIYAQTDVLSMISIIDANDYESQIRYLTSFNFDYVPIYQACFSQDKSNFYVLLIQQVCQKPLLITRLSFISLFRNYLEVLYQQAFPGFDFKGPSADAIITNQVVLQHYYNFCYYSFEMIIQMKDYPWGNNDSNNIISHTYYLLAVIYKQLNRTQQKKLFEKVEQCFLSFTSYVDDNNLTIPTEYTPFAKQRREHISLNCCNILFIYKYLFDTEMLTQSFEKYSKYYIKYGSLYPMPDMGEFEMFVLDSFKNVFNKREDLFIRFLSSKEVLVAFERLQSKKKNLTKFISEMMSKHQNVCQFFILNLLSKIPFEAIKDGMILKSIVAHSKVFTSDPENGKKLITLLIEKVFQKSSTLIVDNRFFSSLNDVLKIVNDTSEIVNSPMFDVSDQIKKEFLVTFLDILNKENCNDASCRFVTSLSALNEKFADFVLSSISTILAFKIKGKTQNLVVGQITIQNASISTLNCWKLISMTIEYSTDLENSITPTVKALSDIFSQFSEDSSEKVDPKEVQYYQICLQKLALFVDESNWNLFKDLFDNIVSWRDFEINDDVSLFLSEMIKCLDEGDVDDIAEGNAILLYNLDELDSFVHSFMIIVLLIRFSSNPKKIVRVLHENYEDMLETRDDWPEKCNEWKHLFDES